MNFHECFRCNQWSTRKENGHKRKQHRRSAFQRRQSLEKRKICELIMRIKLDPNWKSSRRFAFDLLYLSLKHNYYSFPFISAEGEGFKVAMHILNNGRFSIPAACTGSMRFCIRKTVSRFPLIICLWWKYYYYNFDS